MVCHRQSRSGKGIPYQRIPSQRMMSPVPYLAAGHGIAPASLTSRSIPSTVHDTASPPTVFAFGHISQTAATVLRQSLCETHDPPQHPIRTTSRPFSPLRRHGCTLARTGTGLMTSSGSMSTPTAHRGFAQTRFQSLFQRQTRTSAFRIR